MSLLSNFQESNHYRKNKICLACKYFHFGYGSGGICEKKTGCCVDKICDCFDYCSTGKFKWNWRQELKALKTYFYLLKIKLFPHKKSKVTTAAVTSSEYKWE